MKEFLKTPYIGTDGDEFRAEFVEYLEKIISENRWDAMSDYSLYLGGARKAIEEIINEIKRA